MALKVARNYWRTSATGLTWWSKGGYGDRKHQMKTTWPGCRLGTEPGQARWITANGMRKEMRSLFNPRITGKEINEDTRRGWRFPTHLAKDHSAQLKARVLCFSTRNQNHTDEKSIEFPILATTAMIGSVVVSNYLAQFPVNDFMTWGSLTYPVSFLITDVTNRLYGPGQARKIVYAGFAAGIPISVFASPLRIACASGTSFLTSQLLDVYIFHKLRNRQWWQAPLISTSISSCMDSFLFTFLAFYGSDLPWFTLALGDYGIKVAIAIISLGPFRLFIRA